MEMGAVVQTLSVAEASLRAIEAGSDMVLICEQEANFVAARDRLVEAVGEERLSERAVAAAVRRIDRAARSWPASRSSSTPDEFDEVSREIGELKQELKSAEDDGRVRARSTAREEGDPAPLVELLDDDSVQLANAGNRRGVMIN